MGAKPTKDAVKSVKKFLEENYGLEVHPTVAAGKRIPGHITIEPSKTVLHVKGIQKASETDSNAYYPRSYQDLKKGLTNFLVIVYKDIENSFILSRDVVESIFGGLSPTKNKPRFVYRVSLKDGRHHIKCDQKGAKSIDIEDYRNKWALIPDVVGILSKKNGGSNYLLLRQNDASEWEDKEGREYHFGSNVPNEEKLTPNVKAVFFYRENGAMMLRGHGAIKSIVNRGFNGKTTPAGDKIFEKIATIHCYDRFTPHKKVAEGIQNKIISLPNYNKQFAIMQIPKAIYDELARKDVYEISAVVKKTSMPANAFQEWEALLKEKKQVILYGPPGTGKTFVATEFARHISAKYDGRLEIIQFHPSYTYEDFVEGIKPKIVDGQITYEIEDGIFKEFCKCAGRYSGENKIFILIIDEINRGNLSKIFGELVYSLEYRGDERELVLPYSKELFRIPNNIWIIGTMNSADRSISSIDYALRRRFYFLEFLPNLDTLRNFLETKAPRLTKADRETFLNFFKSINDQISADPRLGPQCQIGHSYFMKEDVTPGLIKQIWKYAVKPILEEYFFESKETVKTMESSLHAKFAEETRQS